MSTIVDITAQPTNDPHVKAYHTRFEMSSRPEEGTRGNSDTVGEFGSLILDIAGVVRVHLCPYLLLVTRAPLFEWEEIDPEIVTILKSFAFSQEQIKDAYTNPAPPLVAVGVEGPGFIGPGILGKNSSAN